MPGAVFNGTREIEPRNSISSFLAPNPSAPSRAIERAPPPPSILFQPLNLGPPNLYPPPPAIRWRNPTPGSSILSGVLSTASPPCVFNRVAPAVPPPHPPYPGIHIRRYSQLFLTARTKSSRSAHYGHFLPQPSSRNRTSNPTAFSIISTAKYRSPIHIHYPPLFVGENQPSAAPF